AEVDQMTEAGHRPPHLAVVLVGANAASQTYVNAKIKACRAIGYESSLLHFPPEISQTMLLNTIDELNENEDIDGFIVQLPLPAHIDENSVINRVLPAKDVDGFHPINVGKMALGLDAFISATPGGIVELLKRYEIETSGKHCVVLGRSNIVGGPMSILMRRNTYPGNSTVTIAHSRTQNLKEVCLSADILIAAIGKPEFVTADMVKEGAVVVDVGINRIDADNEKGYKLVGDVAFDEVAQKCSYITPVPGGVGPMTIAYLLNNTMIAARKRM
ncbi:MAG: bifunctional 5,10-methylene-tetrahydrofolate dehydrogenase/5,10-methylene-tetrahydrofolate cyclohydrolase, partial [Salibacteraceae bacterium]|nr:bifunctional 5,10-methylene-tetrahydrofolate dehydrogenase/5,10-methylene-tetrahydrofolate cyclohydrolase [Salibacteraceae bacterium]